MRLAEFIEGEMETILREWEVFAGAQLPAATGMNSQALRDHAQEMLRAITKDMMTGQSAHEQSRKSKGLAFRMVVAPETAAETHAFMRAQSGFDTNQMVAEYRALRATFTSGQRPAIQVALITGIWCASTKQSIRRWQNRLCSSTQS